MKVEPSEVKTSNKFACIALTKVTFAFQLGVESAELISNFNCISRVSSKALQGILNIRRN